MAGKLHWNTSKLIQFALTAQPIYPRYFGVEVGHDGLAQCLPSVGGITYNVLVGDLASGWVADHIEPGVSLGFPDNKSKHITSLNHYACVGNTATVLTGSAKGSKGVVLGHHGGVEHVMVDFAPKVLRKLTYEDKVLMTAHGMGLKAENYPDVVFHNVDPKLAQKLFRSTPQGKIAVSATTTIGGELMGSGLGSLDTTSGDFDIQTADPGTHRKYRIDTLRLGDIVCLDNIAHTFGWSYKQGHITFGVIVHGDSFLSGHGPGVTTICSGPKKRFAVTHTTRANLGRYLLCGRYRK